jgi:hypothetical protein
MSIFTCCERLDESKYWHPCACPSATFNCESEEITPELCGYAEFQNNGVSPSVPPKSYKELQKVASGKFNSKAQDCAGTSYFPTTTEFSDSITCTYDCSDDSISSTGEMIQTFTSRDCIGGVIVKTVTVTPLSAGLNNCNTGGSAQSTTSSIFFQDTGSTLNVTGTLSEEDTDAAAIARETPVDGTSCSSTYEVRGTTYTGFSWTIRTSGYTIECDDLLIGIEYEVTPLIRKRTVVLPSSNFGAWEAVSVTPVSFTATATTHTIDDAGNPIDLDHISGYEYEITGVNIEKKA